MQPLFINYASVDKRHVREMVELLRETGIPVIFEPELKKSATWQDDLRKLIEQSASFIYAMTPDSIASQWCQWAFEQAIKMRKPVVLLLLLPNTEMPEAFRGFPFVDFPQERNTDPASFARAISAAAITLSAASNINSDWTPQGVPTGAVPDEKFMSFYDSKSNLVLFFEQYSEKEWAAALESLAMLAQSPFSTEIWENYRLDILAHAEREKWLQNIDQIYTTLYQKVLSNPSQNKAGLHDFWKTYAGYDPKELYEQFKPDFTRPASPFRLRELEEQIGEEPSERLVKKTIQDPSVLELLTLLNDEKTAPYQRHQAGKKLSEMGDPRPGVRVRSDALPDIDWVLIPGGDFFYSDGRIVSLPDDFYIARYPITYVQFQTFVHAPDGFSDDTWWEELADRHPTPSSPRWHDPNRPCDKVSWYDAMAFCRWLSVKMGFEIRLPNEKEWEKAARGSEWRTYPYGDQYQPHRANVLDTGLQETTAVGIFPAGASPYGVMDMSGNVWEWVLNELDSGDDTNLTNSNKRALRGGAWNSVQRLTTISARDGDFPNMRVSNRGFRIVCKKPILATS